MRLNWEIGGGFLPCWLGLYTLDAMNKVKKALIPAAGLGTRFLPITQSIPKEMLPLVDKPILLYIIEEAMDAGIEDIVIVQGRNKDEIIDFFDCNYELEDKLEKSGKLETLASIQKIRSSVNLISIRQQEALGLGHAVYTGKPILGEESFCVLLGDELMLGDPNPSKEIISIAQEQNMSAVSVMEVPESEVSKYGIASIEKDLGGNVYKVGDLIEKPKASEVNSRLALPGRYVFKPEIFKYLADTKPGKGGEIQLTDAMIQLAKNEGLLAKTISCQRHDTGNKLGYLQAVVQIALEHPEVREGFSSYLKNLNL